MKFRKIFIKETTVDPFKNSITIASACNRVFRKLFLKNNTIGIIPHRGYSKDENQSIIALKWLKWLNHKYNLQIQHKLNGGEVIIDQTYKVDGFLGNPYGLSTVYEFYGCFWHGCPECFRGKSFTMGDKQFFPNEVYQKTIARSEKLKEIGYKLVEKWECQLKEEMRNDEEMASYINAIHIEEPINPRDGEKCLFYCFFPFLHLFYLILS